MGLGCSFRFKVPVWSSSSISGGFVAQPLHSGCFGSTLVKPHVWLDKALFAQYAILFRMCGTSGTGKHMQTGVRNVMPK